MKNNNHYFVLKVLSYFKLFNKKILITFFSILLCQVLSAHIERTQAGAPSVITYAASNIKSNSATLRGSVNPNGASTAYAFFWGTSTSSLDNHSDLERLSAGTTSVTVEYTLTGLSPNTTYFPRIFSSLSSIPIYVNSHLLLNAVSSVKTFWSDVFIVAIMYKFDGIFILL